MVLDRKQYQLLIDMINGSIKTAMNSGIPINPEYYKDIDIIKEKIFEDISILDRRGII